jgi:hypothetical protein
MADKSKDTGTGGINIDGDLYSVDVGASDIEGGNQGKWSPGDVAVDKSVKDISKPTRETFAKYMSRTTLATAGAATHANVYTLDAEVVLPLSTHDGNGNPVSPAQSPNVAKFAPNFDAQMGAPAPLLIKKGIASGINPDGNQLLPGAAQPADPGSPYIKPAKELNDPINSYTKSVLDPNLYSPLHNLLTPNVVIGDGGQVTADKIRPLHVTTGLATDGGASTGIFTPDNNHTQTPEQTAKKATTETENNFYPVVGDVSFVNPSAKNVLADPSGAKKFADVKIGSSPFISKGKLVNNAADNTNLPNGNTLLPSAATLADSGDDYVKFVILSADGKKGLQDPVKSYTNNTIVKNLNNYNTPPVVISTGGLNVSPSSLRDIKIVSNFADDAGTSKNILGPDGNQGLHALSLIKAENLANVTTSAASDGTKNKYAVDATADPSKASTVTLRGADGHPISVTAAQNNPTNSSFFSSKIQASYTTAYVTAIADPTPFLIKRGKESGVDAAAKDGNELLPEVLSALPAGLQTYTSAVLKPNLEAAYDPRVLPSSGADPAGADIGSASGIKSLHKPSSFPVDGGNSANVLSAASSKSLNQLATVVHDKTADNAYPVDSPVVNDKLTIFSLDSSVVLADPSNTKKFADIKIGSVPAVSKGKLINYRVEGTSLFALPDGNVLLPTAATVGPAGGPHVKPAGPLTKPIIDYTKSILDKNLYKFEDLKNDDKSIVENAKSQGEDFFGPKNLYKPDLGPVDLGTFDNIVKNPGKKTITKETLFNYFKNQVNGGENPGNKNLFVVTEPQSIVSITNYDTSDPVSPTDAQASETDKGMYAPASVPSSYSDDVNLLFLKRGKGKKTTSTFADGNAILRSKNDPKIPSSAVDIYVSSVLKNNRFTTSNSFFDDYLNKGFSELSTADQSSFSNQYSMGSHAPSDRKYDFKRLSQVGNILQLKAAGEFVGDSPDTLKTSTSIKTLLPGLGQLDIPRNIEDLNIKKIIDSLHELTTDENKKIDDAQFVDFGQKFEGNINNFIDKFAGFSALGMQVLATSLTLVVALAMEFIMLFFWLATSRNTEADTPSRISGGDRYGIGTFHPTINLTNTDILSALLPGPSGDPNKLLVFFGISRTSASIGKAVTQGVKTFFDPASIVKSPGYYVVMARTLVRAVVKIVLSFEELGKVISGGNLFSAVEQIFEILGTLKHSRFFAVMNLLAQLGDRVIVASADPDVTASSGDAGLKISTIDNLPDEWPGAAFSKSRLGSQGNKTLKLAWSTNRTPDLLLLSKNALDLAKSSRTLGSGRLLTYDPLEKTRFEFSESPGQGRISMAARMDIEKQFESEYLPFYFHDLRTNEIIGFHAFLSTLTDDYTANYEATDAYGRIEPVKIYRGTQRKIGLSFLIASLDPQDFQSMWLKINKLTTLLYPQYTPGKIISLGQNGVTSSRFTKPFSQQIGAPPMIRMRVGNVVASNYSRFNLAGIFGLRDSSAGINGKPASDQFDKNGKIITDYKEDRAKKVKTVILRSREYMPEPKKNPLFGFDNSQYTKRATFNPGNYPGLFYFKIDDASMIDASSTMKGSFIKIPSAAVSSTSAYKLDVDNNVISSVVDGAIFVISTSDIASIVVQDEVNSNPEIADLNQVYSKEVNSFMNSGWNSIVRSFESAGGKGMAGFIDSMNFDWLQGTTWDVEQGNMAPKMCKVTMQFTPIHDITPGLDSGGYNRAPIYPVGPYSYHNTQDPSADLAAAKVPSPTSPTK